MLAGLEALTELTQFFFFFQSGSESGARDNQLYFSKPNPSQLDGCDVNSAPRRAEMGGSLVDPAGDRRGGQEVMMCAFS